MDRSLGRYVVVKALTAAGFLAIAHDDHFLSDARDEEWLTRAGKEGWIVLTRDQQIRYRQSELESIIAAKVMAFIVAAHDATGQEVAALIVKHAARMLRIATGQKPPAAYAIHRNGPPMRLPLGRSGGARR